MQRVQFYPSDDLGLLLNEEAVKSGVSVSRLVTEILEKHYGLSKNTQSIMVLTIDVLKEIEDFVGQSPSSTVFDIYTASETYRGISMTEGRKPQTIRASIGRSFVAKIGGKRFPNVSKHILNNKQVLSKNNAMMYIIQ